MNLDIRQWYMWLTVLIFNAGVIGLIATAYRFDVEYILRKQNIVVIIISLLVSVIPALLGMSQNPSAKYVMYGLSGILLIIAVVCGVYYLSHTVSGYASGYPQILALGSVGLLVLVWIFYGVGSYFS